MDDTALKKLEDAWIKEMTERFDEVTAWARDFGGFVTVIRHAGGRISPCTRAFYQAWIDAAAKDPEEAYSDDRLADLVREREQHLKRRNAQAVEERGFDQVERRALRRRPTGLSMARRAAAPPRLRAGAREPERPCSPLTTCRPCGNC